MNYLELTWKYLKKKIKPPAPAPAPVYKPAPAPPPKKKISPYQAQTLRYLKKIPAPTPITPAAAPGIFEILAVPPAPPPAELMISAYTEPETVPVNTPIIFHAVISGGTPPYSIMWSGAISGEWPDVIASFETSGTKTAKLEVIDATGKRKTTSVSAIITKVEVITPPPPPALVPPELMISATAGPTTALINTPITFSAMISGGTPPYRIMWSGAISGTTETITASFETSGTKTARLEVIDSVGVRKTTSVSVIITAPPAPPPPEPLTVEIWGYNPNIRVGDTTIFNARVSGGTPPYKYMWSGAVTGDVSYVFFTPGTTGTKTAKVTVTDAKGKTATASATITVTEK